MKGLVLAFLALAAYATAAPENRLNIDVYRNTLKSSEARIIGGVEANRRQFPYQASLQWGILGSYSHVCGAVLIKENWLLTASHCHVYSIGSYRVVLGQLEQNEEHEDIQIIDVDKFIIHHNYPGGVAANDIAVLKLKSPAVLTPAVQLANLPTDEQCSSLEDTILTGWGLTSVIPIPPKLLRYAKLPRISLKECADALRELLGETGPLDETMICTGAQEGTKQAACSGDSGGPLVLASGENTTLVGIVSWGLSPCGTKGAPSIYTNPCSHRQFIDLIIA